MSHTWIDLAEAAGVPREEADYMLWNASAFPFADVRTVYKQLRHTVRHRACIDPAAQVGLDEDGEPDRDPSECWPDWKKK